MKIYSFAALWLAFATTSTGKEEASILRIRLLDDAQSEAPSEAMFSAGMETPQPTVSDGFGGNKPVSAPTNDALEGAPSDAGGMDEAPVESPSMGGGGDEVPPTLAGFDEETDPPGSDAETPSPGAGEDWSPESETPDPNESEPTDAPTPPPYTEPSKPSHSSNSHPSHPPQQASYHPEDDDPLQPINSELTDDVAWKWTDSSVEEVEHDRTVLMAVTVSFSIGILLALLTAHQMLENPHGCCASICRIYVACSCGIFRCLCYPCRAMCGCTNNERSRRNHDIISENANYTHDLELS